VDEGEHFKETVSSGRVLLGSSLNLIPEMAMLAHKYLTR